MKISEKKLQEAVHFFLSDPSVVRRTVSGKRLQILSPGRINQFEGPDFIDIAILLEGMLIIGNAEFHRNSSDWIAHNHNSDKRYDTVILHIVFNNNIENNNNSAEVLILDQIEIENIATGKNVKKIEADLKSIEELQHYALLRLLRKTSEAQRILSKSTLKDTLQMMVQDYLNRYLNMRKRPYYTGNKIETIKGNLGESKLYEFLDAIKNQKDIHIPDFLHQIIKEKISDEGPHLRREIVLNCVLPLAICLANEEARIDLFLWYWSTPALHEYGNLKRKFIDLPQNFLWQQQGMLEYLKEHGRKPNVVSDAVKYYGFAEVLSFYRLGMVNKLSE